MEGWRGSLSQKTKIPKALIEYIINYGILSSMDRQQRKCKAKYPATKAGKLVLTLLLVKFGKKKRERLNNFSTKMRKKKVAR